MNCRYCFYRRHPPGRMSGTLATRMVNSYMALPMLDHEICFQGGEPLLLPRSFYERLDLFGCAVSVQTNATLITPEWAEFFARNRWLVGVSLDGSPTVNDVTRGKTTEAVQGIRLLERYGVDYSILCVVSRANVGEPEATDHYLRDNFSAPFRQYIRCAEEVSLPEYREFSSRVGYELPERCCGSYLVVEHDGNVYPCDFYVADEWRLGNIGADSWESLRDSALYREFQNRVCEMI